MSKRVKQDGKAAAVATYLIAVVALIAAMFLPITNKTFSGGGFHFSHSPVMQLGGAMSALGLPVNAAFADVYSFGAAAFDLGAALLLLYALTALAAAVIVIPAFAAKGVKARNAVSVGELLALTALLPLSVLELLRTPGVFNLNILVAFGITLLMLIIQCLIYKKGSGVVKIILFVLSAVATLFAVADLGGAIPALASPLASAANALKGRKPFETSVGLYSVNGSAVFGRELFADLFAKNFDFSANGSLSVSVLGWLGLAASALVIVNLYPDMLGLGKKTNRFMTVANIIRYGLEFALVAALAIAVVFAPASYGLGLYLLAAIALIQLLIQIIRGAVFKKSAVPAAADAAETEARETVADASPEELPSETAAASTDPYVETRQVVYNVNTIYNGPTDEFIRKLSVDQKVEFARLFLEKRTGSSEGIPDYIVGGDNSRFFSMLFIYFTRIRNIVSDGLMNKFYEEVKAM